MVSVRTDQGVRNRIPASPSKTVILNSGSEFDAHTFDLDKKPQRQVSYQSALIQEEEGYVPAVSKIQYRASSSSADAHNEEKDDDNEKLLDSDSTVGADHDHPVSVSLLLKQDLKMVLVLFLSSLVGIVVYLQVFLLNELTDDEKNLLRIPTSLSAAQELGRGLALLSSQHLNTLKIGHALLYLFFQTFCIPGTVFINLLGGALFGMYTAFPLCLLYNTVGSVFMFLLSQNYGSRAIHHQFPQKLEQMRSMMDGHRSDLTIYMTFLRVFPFTPNWFMNMASPHLAIPLHKFAFSVFVGLAPYNFVSCKAGLILSKLRSRSDIIDGNTTLIFISVAIVGFFGYRTLKKHFRFGSSAENSH